VRPLAVPARTARPLLRVITVSLETKAIVKGLPALEILE
jgi:hypothetical protein